MEAIMISNLRDSESETTMESTFLPSPASHKSVDDTGSPNSNGNNYDDGSYQSLNGYDADSENHGSMKTELTVHKRACRYSKKRSSEDMCDVSSTLSRHPRRRRRRKLDPDCSWIERIYASTPFRTPKDSNDYAVVKNAIIAPISRDSPVFECPVDSAAIESQIQGGKDRNFYQTVQISPPSTFHPIAVPPSPTAPSHCMAGTLMDTLNLQNLDDEPLTLALLSIVENLLRDSHKSQATYRSYSFNSGVSAKSLATKEPR